MGTNRRELPGHISQCQASRRLFYENLIISNLSKHVKDFYNKAADTFSDSRGAAWLGWEILWEKYFQQMVSKIYENSDEFHLLDVGCGNGRFGEFFIKKAEAEIKTSEKSYGIKHGGTKPDGIKSGDPLNVKYFGIDISKNLLEKARSKLEIHTALNIEFAEVDITNIAKLQESLEQFGPKLENSQKFDLIAIAAVFHHISTQKTRIEILETLAKYMKPGGILFFSLWNFMSSQRLREKLSKPESIKYQGENVALKDGDYLMTWQGYEHLRYVHNFSEEEIEEFRRLKNLKFLGDFFSEGKNHKLNHYLVFKNL